MQSSSPPHPFGPRPMPKILNSLNQSIEPTLTTTTSSSPPSPPLPLPPPPPPEEEEEESLSKQKLNIRRIDVLDHSTTLTSNHHHQRLEVSQFTQPRPAPAIPCSLIPDISRTIKGPGNSLFLHQGFLDILTFTKGSISKKFNQDILNLHSNSPHHTQSHLLNSDWNTLQVCHLVFFLFLFTF